MLKGIFNKATKKSAFLGPLKYAVVREVYIEANIEFLTK